MELPRIGCCGGGLGLLVVVLVVFIALALCPLGDDGSAPAGPSDRVVAVHVDLASQAIIEVAPGSAPLSIFESPVTTKVIRLSDAELTSLLRQRMPLSRVGVRSEIGRLTVLGETTNRIQADGWLVVEGGRLRLRLHSLAWRGLGVPRPVLGLAAGQVNGELEQLFPLAEVTTVAAGEGEMAITARPLGQGAGR